MLVTIFRAVLCCEGEEREGVRSRHTPRSTPLDCLHPLSLSVYAAIISLSCEYQSTSVRACTRKSIMHTLPCGATFLLLMCSMTSSERGSKFKQYLRTR